MAKKERKLSKQELERKEKFEKYTSEMVSQGYIKKDLTISVVKANFMGIVLALPIMFLIQVVYYNVNTSIVFASNTFAPRDFGYYWMLFLGTYLILVVAHELIHGITWAIFAKNGFKSISFGIIWKYVTPYCTCNSSAKEIEYMDHPYEVGLAVFEK